MDKGVIRSRRNRNNSSGHNFSRLPIHKQFLVVSGLSVFMIMLLSFLMLKSVQQIVTVNVTNYVNLFTEKYGNQLETLFFQLDVLCSEFQTDELYRTLLSADSYQDLTPEIIDEVNGNIAYIKSLNNNIVDVAFANELIHWSTLFSEEDLDALYRQALQDGISTGHGVGLFKSSFLPLADMTYYVYCSKIYRFGKPVGCAFISLDIAQLNLDSSDADSPASFFIMDREGDAYGLSRNTKQFEAAVLDACPEYISLTPDSALPQYTVSDDSYSIQMLYSEAANCYIISAVYIPAIRAQLSDISFYIWFILILVVVFSLVLIAVLYRNMALPLNQFNNVIEDIRSQRQRHLKYPLNIRGCAEVHNLAQAFSNMFSDIDELNMQIFEASSKLYEEKIRTQATQIDYFRSPITPHTKGDPVVPFREEVEMTKAYIEIQKLRFRSKFDILYNIPEEAMEIPVIKLILQPIVENAIQHGIEPALEHCILYIGCTVTEKEFLVEVRDDGVGMPGERMREIQQLLSQTHYDTANYVGIINTHARLKLQYGDDYGITIDGAENDGTVVTIHLPVG